MAGLLLVDLDDAELDRLAGVEVPAVRVAARHLDEHLDDAPDAVVVSGLDPARAVAAVQHVHRRAPDLPIAVLVGASTERELRRHVRIAADVPADLELLSVDSADLPERVAELCRTAALRRSHARVLADIGARESARPHASAVVGATLGTLLEHAPLGVVVTDLGQRVLACNGAAVDLLRLPPAVHGSLLTDLFPDADELTRLVTVATSSDATDPWPELTLRGPGGSRLDVSAARTRLEDGRDVVMLLVGDATARFQAEQERDMLSGQVAMMGRVSELVLGTPDPEDALRLIADQVVPTLGDWVAMHLYDERGATRHVVTRHSDPALAGLTALLQDTLGTALSDDSPSRRLARGEAPLLLSHLDPELIRRFVPDARVRDTLLAVGVDSAIAVPLEGRRTRLGSMVLVNRAGSVALGEQELAIAVEVGRRVGIALETLHLYSQQRALAEELQRSMLTDPPKPAHAEIAVRYRPAANEAQVGGDWYDAYVQTDGSIVLSIGDVVGHDYRAAAAMGQLRGLLRGIGYASGAGPADMLRSLDTAIDGLLPGTTATAVVALVQPQTAPESPFVLRWSNAGHPPPLLLQQGGEPVVLAGRDTDLILGVVADVRRQEARAGLGPGDTVVLYSDGLIERRGQDLDDGLAALREALREADGLPVEELCDHLLDRLVPREQDDDVALVALRLR